MTTNFARGIACRIGVYRKRTYRLQRRQRGGGPVAPDGWCNPASELRRGGEAAQRRRDYPVGSQISHRKCPRRGSGHRAISGLRRVAHSDGLRQRRLLVVILHNRQYVWMPASSLWVGDERGRCFDRVRPSRRSEQERHASFVVDLLLAPESGNLRVKQGRGDEK